MTLLRQMMLVVIAMFIVVFSGNFVLTVLESRSYIETQLRAHAQDTATSLALSLTTALTNDDDVSLELLTSAVFDRGYYSEIKLVGVNGDVLVNRTNKAAIDNVPEWFYTRLDLPSPEGRAEISQGWRQLGTLSVRAHPGNAYRDLWRITVDFLWLFALIVVLSYGLFGIVIRFVMAPLRSVENQANDICNQQFAILEPVPRTRELKRVVEAMNRMSSKLNVMFDNQISLTEKLRIEAKTDPLTGLINRREFDSLVSAILDSEEGPGSSMLLLLSIKDFSLINEELGYSDADRLLIQVSQRLTDALAQRDNAIISRRNGAEFAIYISHTSLEVARLTLERTFQRVATLQQFTDSNLSSRIHMAAAYSDEVITLSDLLTEADTGLRSAQASITNSSYFVIHGDRDNPVSDLVKQAGQWRQIIKDNIESDSILFHYQPIIRLNADGSSSLLANEIFARIKLDEQIVSAGVFMPMAERFSLLVELDQLIINRVMATPPRNDQKLVINLSTYSIQNDHFRAWLLEIFEKHKRFANNIIFEIQEHAVHLAHDDTKSLVDSGYQLGYQFSIDHFGASATSFAYLQNFNVSFIKVDRSFVSDIDTKIDNQFFVQSVAQIAHARDMLIIAEGVERVEELETLKNLNIDAAMGYLLGRPGPEISLN